MRLLLSLSAILALAAGAASCGTHPPPPPTGPSGEASAQPTPTTSASSASPENGAKNPDVRRGLDALAQGQYPTARSLCEIAAKKDPSDGEAQFCLGAAAEKMDDKAKAETYYKAALKLQPDLEPA